MDLASSLVLGFVFVDGEPGGTRFCAVIKKKKQKKEKKRKKKNKIFLFAIVALNSVFFAHVYKLFAVMI